MIKEAQLPAHKDKLRRQTEAAQVCGIFGAPMAVSGAEMFCGKRPY